jgi:hypothetical protein
MQDLSTIIIFVLAALFLVVILETYLLIRLSKHYNRFLKDSKTGLSGVLENIQKTHAIHESRIIDLDSRLATHITTAQKNLSNLVVKRFNPFSDTGGDQSFMLSLLDGHKTGVVITSLHSRENTRFYVKPVVEGQGDPYPLSADEQKLITKGK